MYGNLTHPSTAALFYILLLPRQNSRAKCFKQMQAGLFLFISYEIMTLRATTRCELLIMNIYKTAGEQEFSSYLNIAIKSQYLNIMSF